MESTRNADAETNQPVAESVAETQNEVVEPIAEKEQTVEPIIEETNKVTLDKYGEVEIIEEGKSTVKVKNKQRYYYRIRQKSVR